MITAATALLILTIASVGIPTEAYGQITLQPTPTIFDNTLSLNISFANNTNATLTNEPITEEQGNLIVEAVNTVLTNLAEDLEDIEELEPLLEKIEEKESSDGNANDDEDNDNDNGGNDDNGNGSEPELPPIEPIEPIEPPVEGGTEIRLELDEDNDKEIITKGCPDDYGYYEDEKWICTPINDNGELETEPPEDTAFCAALGCPWNPPSR